MLPRVLDTIGLQAERIRSIRLNYYLRKDDEKICDLHKGQWDPLTPSELRSIDRKDRWAFTIYKNMAGTENFPYYVSDALHKTMVVPALNPLNHAPYGLNRDSCFADKNYEEIIMTGLRFPNVVLRRMRDHFYDPDYRLISPEEASARIALYSELVFKQSIGAGHGHGVRLLSAAEYPDTMFRHASDYVVQERVIQHPVLSYFNESSVNILRITSVCLDGEVYILGGILRIGAPGSFCDHTPHGGTHNLDVGINPDGTLAQKAFDPDHCHVYDNVYGKPIQGTIPRYNEILDLIRQEHIKYPRYGLIGWDFTIDKDENIICMEFNTKWPGISATQYAHGAVFSQKTKAGVPLLDAILAQSKK